MSRSKKPHKILAQAQRDIRKYGWTTRTWHSAAGMCLQGAVGIRGGTQAKATMTRPRMTACEYIGIAAATVLAPRIEVEGTEQDKEDLRSLQAHVANRLEYDKEWEHLGLWTRVPTINDTMLKDEEEALAVLEHAEKLAFHDYFEEKMKARAS